MKRRWSRQEDRKTKDDRERRDDRERKSDHKRQDGLERREFLQVGLLGGAAAAAGMRPAAAQSPPKSSKTPPTTPADPAPPLECQVSGLVGAQENWNEPWVWRPSDWPGQQLDLNVVVNQNPGIEVGLGNPGSIFFSYGGNTPGPTIRMRGDETLAVKLRNLLSEDCGENFVGPFPDLGDLPPAKDRKRRKAACPPSEECTDDRVVNVCDLKPAPIATCTTEESAAQEDILTPQEQLQKIVREKATARGQHRFDFCLGEHTNGLHSAHVTNLHTHGLHVRPDKNPDGTNSDNVILRVLSQGDFKRRERVVLGQEAGERCICHQTSTTPICQKCGGLTEPEPICGTDNAPDEPRSACRFLRRRDQAFFIRDDEIVGESDYEFRLGDVMGDPNQPHPAGTFWYHPHAHGATDIQVSSGMAGYLIVEGAEDDNINCRLTGTPHPDPTIKTGPWDYRERLMFMQRIFPTNILGDPDSPSSRIKKVPTPVLNGSEKAGVINMRPGAVERWRVLNGSVDGRGFKHFMVVKGFFDIVTTGFAPQVAEADVPRSAQAVPLTALAEFDPVTGEPIDPETGKPVKTVMPVDVGELEKRKCRLFQLSIDGITLVKVEKGKPKYFIKDLAQQFFDCGGSGKPGPNPLAVPQKPTCTDADGQKIPVKTPSAQKLSRIESVFKNADNIRNTWVRPNEFYMGPANRTDVFFQLPEDAKCGDVFTVLARASVIHADTPVFSLQETVNCENPSPGPSDIVVAHIVVVDERKVEGAKEQSLDELMADLNDCLPDEVLPYLHPVTDEELRVSKSENCHRTRVAYYSGWGNEGSPLVTTDENDPSAAAFKSYIRGKSPGVHNGPELRDLRYMFLNENGDVVPAPGKPTDLAVLLSPNTRTMSIGYGPPYADKDYLRCQGRKFNPNDPARPFVEVNTCEEWAVYNTSTTLWGFTDTSEAGNEKHPQPGQFRGHYVSYPIDRRSGQQEFWKCENLETESGIPDFRIVTRGIDHPFHIHQNPFWVLRIEIPDENGNLVNILSEPRWMDSLWIPRNNGRIVFRSRFADFVGIAVHHCHILQHEDNGMMTALQLTPFPEMANYEKRRTVAKGTDPCRQSSEEVDAIYPPPSLEESYVRNLTFLDSNLPPAKPGQQQVYVAQEHDQEPIVPNTGQNYPGFVVTPPTWPPGVRGQEAPCKTAVGGPLCEPEDS